MANLTLHPIPTPVLLSLSQFAHICGQRNAVTVALQAHSECLQSCFENKRLQH